MNAELVDSNVLVYAHDPTTPAKHNRARSLVERL
jgi:predicted nucleic acid-binding protein